MLHVRVPQRKRGGRAQHVGHSEVVTLEEIAESRSQTSAQRLALDEALDDLAAMDLQSR